MNRVASDFLTADSTFMTGAGTIFNLAGSYYRFNSSPTTAVADTKALFMDWAIVGQDLKDAMRSFESENQLKFSFVD
jgi:hypothetical protein